LPTGKSICQTVRITFIRADGLTDGPPVGQRTSTCRISGPSAANEQGSVNKFGQVLTAAAGTDSGGEDMHCIDFFVKLTFSLRML
jgi:hypothetical protein